MVGYDILVGMKENLQRSAKDGKVHLIFSFPEGHPLRKSVIRKIRGVERIIKGIEVMLAGGTSAEVQEGYDEVIAVTDELIGKVTEEDFRTYLYGERALMLSMKIRFSQMDELLELPDESGDDEVILN